MATNHQAGCSNRPRFTSFAGIAQMDSAVASGATGPWFESKYRHQFGDVADRICDALSARTKRGQHPSSPPFKETT